MILNNFLSLYDLLFIGVFIFTILLDHFIVSNHFKFINKSSYINFRNLFYPIINITLFFIFLFIYLFIFGIYFELDFNITGDLGLNVTDKNNDINVGTNATVNVNHPNIKASVSKEGINSIAAAISSAGGATVGLKVAQYVGGPPSTKIMAGLGTMAVVQASTAIMSRVLNNGGTNSSNDNVNKFVYSFTSSNGNGINLNDYPLNLLFEINTLLYAALLFLFIILNIYIAKYVSNLNYSKFIPKNKFGYILNLLIARYLKIWTKTSNFLLIFSYLMLFLAVFISKITLWIIFNFYS